MTEHAISMADRGPFFAAFSRLHEGAQITLRVRERDEVVNQPFRGVSPDGAEVIVHTGYGPGKPHHGHRVPRVSTVGLEQVDGGADAALTMMSDDGTRTVLRFRWPIRADLLDPAVE